MRFETETVQPVILVGGRTYRTLVRIYDTHDDILGIPLGVDYEDAQLGDHPWRFRVVSMPGYVALEVVWELDEPRPVPEETVSEALRAQREATTALVEAETAYGKAEEVSRCAAGALRVPALVERLGEAALRRIADEAADDRRRKFRAQQEPRQQWAMATRVLEGIQARASSKDIARAGWEAARIARRIRHVLNRHYDDTVSTNHN